VDIFVDKALLTGARARIAAAFNKLHTEAAKIKPHEINDLKSHQLSRATIMQSFFYALFVHN
jgi:hypothetical protein